MPNFFVILAQGFVLPIGHISYGSFHTFCLRMLLALKVGRVFGKHRQLLQSSATGNRKRPSVSQDFETLSFWKTTWPSSSTKPLVVKPTPKNLSGLTTSGCEMWFILIGKLHLLIQNWNIYLSIPTGTSLFADANNQVSEHRSVLQNARSR